MAKMSEGAQRLLVDATGRIGAQVSWRCDPAAEDELKDLGLISKSGNLTTKGLAARDRVMTERLDKAFG